MPKLQALAKNITSKSSTTRPHDLQRQEIIETENPATAAIKYASPSATHKTILQKKIWKVALIWLNLPLFVSFKECAQETSSGQC